MGYEEVEFLKASICIFIMIGAIIAMIIGERNRARKQRRYMKWLEMQEQLEYERKQKKLENLKLETIYLDLNRNEIERLDNLARLNRLNRSQTLRNSIKNMINEEL